jgi:hypothetical protein
MDIETLAERDDEHVERARRLLDGPSLTDFIADDEVKGLYESIYADSGFGDVIAETRPTYYRKDSALAAGYAAADTDPVIVFLKPSITHESDLIDYTGMNTQFFLTQVAEGQIIPVRAKAEKYDDNPFYRSFFDDWRHHPELSGRYPVFANAVEEVLDRDFNEADFWKPKAKELAERFDLVGEMVQPTEELPERVATKYLAERLVYLRAVNQDTVADLVRGLLQRYHEARSGSAEARQYLEDAATAAFFGSMLYASPVFRSMGSSITLSRSDYANAVRWLNQVVETRRQRSRLTREFVGSLVEITAPISSSLLNLDDKARSRLTVPENGRLHPSAFDGLSNNETVARTLEETTSLQHRHADDLEAAMTSGSFDRLADSYEELREVRTNLRETKLEEVGAAKEWLRTPINYASEIVGHLPLSPVGGDPGEAVLNVLTSNQTYDFFDAVVRAYRQEEIQEFVERKPAMTMRGRVWESDYRWADRERLF